MTLLEALIIYLSAGAPFGALVLFAQRPAPVPVAILHAAVATLAWPVFGTYRLFRGLTKRKARHVRSTETTPIEVLRQIADEIPSKPAELFEIAGHSNPWLATNCYARARKRVIESHIERLSHPSDQDTEMPVVVPTEKVIANRYAPVAGS